jgi:hypothetical protein
VIVIYLCAAFGLVTVGLGLGVLVVVSLAIHREDRQLSLTADVASRAARGTRALTGVYTHVPQPVNPSSPQDSLPV